MSEHRVESVWKKQISLGMVLAVLCVIGIGLWMLHLFSETSAVLPSHSAGLGLTEYVESVRKDLEKVEADRVRNGDPSLFAIKDFDLELNVVVRTSDKGTGEFKSEVVTAGMEKELSRELTQKITLHMMPAGPEKLEIGEAPDLSTEGGTPLPTVYLKEKKK